MENERRNEESAENEIYPEMVEKIRTSKFAIDAKINLLLTLGRKKPASDLVLIIGRGRDKHFVSMAGDEINEHISLVENSGLKYKILPKSFDVDWQSEKSDPGHKHKYTVALLRFLVAGDQDKMNALVASYMGGDAEAKGIAFGIQKDAVDAFTGKVPMIKTSDLPKDVREREAEAIAFSTPTLSAERWAEGLEQGKEWSEFIKKVSPELHKEYVEMRSNGSKLY